jgi:two-component system sensor histidine kinase VicK
VDVEIRYEDGILVTIQDTGIGISRNQIPRLFSKFFRADNAVRMQTSGSGLGLFIAKNIIEKHGGKIWIESEEGKGTTVSFTLPFSRFKK